MTSSVDNVQTRQRAQSRKQVPSQHQDKTFSRRQKLDMTDSWDAVDDSQVLDQEIYTREEERGEMGSQYEDSQSVGSDPLAYSLNKAKDQAADSFIQSQANAVYTADLVSDPESDQYTDPDSDADLHVASVPRRRGDSLARSSGLIMPASPDGLTDGNTTKQRAKTPHFRSNQRSLTSDAGAIRRAAAAKKAEVRPPAKQAKTHRSQTKPETHGPTSSIFTSISGILNWALEVLSLASSVLTWVFDILSMAANNPLVKLAFSVLVLIVATSVARRYVMNGISNTISPICSIPLVSSFVPFCTSYNSEIAGNAEFDQLMQTQSQFHDVLSSSAHSAYLATDMKRGEASIRDLRQVVKYSSLPSRNELVSEFTDFIDSARQASSDLSKFNTRIGSAVDKILSTNKWTLRVLQSISERESDRGQIARFVQDNLNIFAPAESYKTTLMYQYQKHTDVVEEQVLSLIQEAQALRGVLYNLDGRLDLIAEVAVRDGLAIENDKDLLFANLWTKLGGNRNTVKKYEKQLKLLRDVGQYKMLALNYVSATILKLESIRDQLEDLRERVAMPETIGRDIPLEVHIDNINLGIDRLEMERDSSRKLLAADYSKIVGASAESTAKQIEAKIVY